MATAKPTASMRPRRLPWRSALVVLAVACLAAFAWFRRPLHAYAITSAAYGARIGCSCRFVEGRELGACRQDFDPGMRFVRLSEDDAAKSVTAGFPLLAHQTATYRAGQGCVLEKWSD